MPALSDSLSDLLAGRYRDPESGASLSVPVHTLVIEPSLRDRELELISTLDFGPRLVVIGDDDTFAALGDRVVHALRSRFTVQRLSLGRAPHADDATLTRLLAAVEPDIDAVIAIGSGTLNDLCKLVAKKRGCPQAVFATAPSMNGYTSVSASLTERGLKRSIRAETPRGVFFDLQVLAAAPPRLIRAGLGDSLCRPTAQVDWLLAHELWGQPYREAPFALLAADEQVLMSAPQALVSGDLEVMRSLARTLALSGFGMTLCGGSYPASQGEHLLCHYVDMLGLSSATTFHGEQVGVATLAMARLQHHLLDADHPPQLAASTFSEASLREHLGPTLGASCWQEARGKQLDAARAAALSAHLAARWSAVRQRLTAVLRPVEQLEAALLAAGAPTSPRQLGWSAETFTSAVLHAREIRDRYTFLDLAADSGLWNTLAPSALLSP